MKNIILLVTGGILFLSFAPLIGYVISMVGIGLTMLGHYLQTFPGIL